MPISITNSIQSTYIFITIFIIGLILTIRRKDEHGFSKSLTQELKGFAILAIVFAHIGYYLTNNNHFLFPLSIAAGVGVNLFLFLSGFGLVMSSISKKSTVLQFYKNRLKKLYVPMLFTLLLFISLDFLILNKTYGLLYMGQSFLGFFLHADLFIDINSPLWYFTFIIFYYLLFPVVFYRKQPWISGIILFILSYLLILSNPTFLQNVIYLYRTHFIAFPLGVFVAGLIIKYKNSSLESKIKDILHKIELHKILKNTIYWIFIGILLWTIGYTLYYSNIGKGWLEQATSLLTCGSIILLFLNLKFESRFLYWFGIFSYEIYLLHWPIMARFDIFYRFFPAWFATIVYLGFFILASWAMQKTINFLEKK